MVLVLIGLTGSAIVFYRYLEEQIYADSLLIAPQTIRPLSIDQALQRAVDAYPDGTVMGIMPPRHEAATYLAYRYYPKDKENYGFSYLSIHPYTGNILGEREFGKTIMTFLYSLHYTLTLGTPGATIVGFIGIFFLFSLFSGLYLWWPKAGKWKQALWFKKNAGAHRRNFDIHRVFGFYPMIILVTLAFSGIYMIFPEQIKWGIRQFADTGMEEFHFTAPLPANSVTLSYAKVIDIARTVYPDAVITDFDRPHDASHPFTVSFKDPHQPMTSYGYNTVSIHPVSGDIIQIQRWEDTSAAAAFLAWQFPLHNGEAFGLAGKWMIFITGFIPLILYTTGLLMWLKRRKARPLTRATKLQPAHAVKATS